MDSDYDLVAVGESFASEHWLDRAPDQFKLWREAGGFGLGLDLHCCTPEEFGREMEGVGYLAHARARSGLTKVGVSFAVQAP